MATKSIEELALEVIRGVWGNGAERKRRLTEAGYDYSAVQKRVNEILGASPSSSSNSSRSSNTSNSNSSSSYNENSTTSGNAYSGRNLKRMKLSYAGVEVKFAVNPEDYTQSEPNKATITQTKGGAWIDAWGAGIVEITIKGTTGVKGNTNSIDVGYQRWKELRNLVRGVYEAVTDGEEIKDLIQFYNFTDNEYYYCYPAQGGIELYRSKSRPHAYQYTVHLWAIRKIGQPETSSGVIGNPNKVANSGGSVSSGSTTTRNTVVETASGKTYTTRNLVTGSGSDKTTVTNTKTKSNADIQNDCKEYMEVLEPLIGGKAGKISPVTGFQSTQGVTMQSSGTISNVTSFTGTDLSEDLSILISEIRFISKVSTETYDLYSAMKDYSPEALSPAYSLVIGLTPKQRVIQAVSDSTAYDSTIFELIMKYQPRAVLSKNEINHLKVILLESMMVYRELYNIYNTESELTTTLTMTHIEILINNIRAMIMYFTLNSTESNKYERMDVSSELRKLEKVMTQVKTDIVDYL